MRRDLASAFVCSPGSVTPFCFSAPHGKQHCAGLRPATDSRGALLSLQASNMGQDKDKEDFAMMAQRAKEEAEKAAQRAAAIKKVANKKKEAENAALKAAALRKFIAKDDAPGVDSSEEIDSGASSGSAEKRRFERNFFDLTLEKPMGLVLEENHESIRGVFVADVVSGSNAARCNQEVVGCQLVSLCGGGEGAEEGQEMFEAMGLPLDDVIAAITAAPTPVTVKLYSGSASSLYGGWNEEAKGKEVTIATNLPNKQLIDRIRSGL